MKGIILAGGTGSRLYPLTKVTNKHLLPVGKFPMIYHSIYKLKEAGIEDILIVTGREHMGDVVNLLGSGAEFDVSLTYRVQDEAGGIAEALGLAKTFTHHEPMVVILGDNIFQDNIAPYVESYKDQGLGAKLLVSEVDDPERFGVPEIVGDFIVSIEEKPLVPKSRYAVTGIYMFDSTVFDIIDTLIPSARGELEITDVNNAYIAKGALTFNKLEGYWTDAGTHSSLARANLLVQDIDFSPLFSKETALIK
ncbi:sugar phosphate nucleotidyltransferase [Guptibacillus hwajinpoensis]|uniref:Glucose-1-phosphate thymidylyltransferase n=1 Tax=Guptibacillus hwajinpoensis TaxID=208199 RepID=A0A0J6CUJ2_9BACL|nr:sugar phosphate nucleotidyltransferase [Alkalihalobacillus macyae]KMM36730.1 spore coat protein [Alkalihalobacillus macyae]